MLPDKILLNFKPDEYLTDNYPATNDCVILDKQLGDLSKDLEKITKMQPTTRNAFDRLKQIAIIKATKNKILLLLKTRENQSTLKDCRNKFETTRQEETANIFSTTTSQAETRIISDSKQKQYVLLGVGGLVLLGVLFIVIKNRK